MHLQQPPPAVGTPADPKLQVLVPVIEAALRSSVARAVLPAAYILRELCLHRSLFKIITTASGILNWCLASLAPGEMEQPNNGFTPVSAASARAMIYLALANLCSHRGASDGNAVDVVNDIVLRTNAPMRTGGFQHAAVASLQPRPKPAPGAEHLEV